MAFRSTDSLDVKRKSAAQVSVTRHAPAVKEGPIDLTQVALLRTTRSDDPAARCQVPERGAAMLHVVFTSIEVLPANIAFTL
jgi:hypothetical protein